MLVNSEIRNIYSDIQKQLFYMIPEKWESVYLYASVLEHYNNVQTGEMFFYYYPKSLIKKNPINVYEIPSKFNLDEEPYLKLAEKLYETIKKLRKALIDEGEQPWSNLTIKIENFKFNVEYHYEDLTNSKYTSYDRHLVWRYKYLNIPLSSYSKKDKEMVEKYLSEEKNYNSNINTYNEGIYKKISSDIAGYDKQEVDIENSNNIEIDKEVEESNEENKEIIKSQILKY